MKISDKNFVKSLVASNVEPNKMIQYLHVSEKLLKKHGKVIFNTNYADIIKQSSQPVYELLLLLKQIGKDNATNIKNIIRLLKQLSPDYKPEFVIKSDSSLHISEIKKHLTKEFDKLEVQDKQTDQDVVSISGEGWYYKRGFEQDVKKLLSL